MFPETSSNQVKSAYEDVQQQTQPRQTTKSEMSMIFFKTDDFNIKTTQAINESENLRVNSLGTASYNTVSVPYTSI